ncbi:MAG: hypothetical protein K1X75_11070 [Leptospirales bacterium]|nr:hypothetical protein [Leptospirales bacterium]
MVRRFGQILLLCTALFSLLWTPGCKSNGEEKEEGASGGFRAELECGNPPQLAVFSRETGKRTEAGAVEIPEGKTCDQMEDASDLEKRRLPRTGEWLFFHENSSAIAYRGVFVAGKREGEFRFFNEQGQLTRTIEFHEGQKQGQEIGYFPGGSEWKERGQNAGGKKNGAWEIRAAANSNCLSHGNFRDDEKDGLWEECEQHPQTRAWFIAFRGSYRQGLRDGRAQFLNPEGQVLSEGEFRADTSEACLREPPGGQRANCGKRTGQWRSYYAPGRVSTEGGYNAETGRRSGRWVEYYQSGQKMAEGPREHTRNGLWTFYAKSGAILGQYFFESNDFSPRRAVVYEDGHKVGEGEVAAGLVKYDQERDELKISGMARNGAWRLYGAGGQIVGEGEYAVGKKQGRWRELRNGSWVYVCYMIGRETACQ